MPEPISQYQLITLGKMLWHLESVSTESVVPNVWNDISNLRQMLKECGAESTLAASASLEDLKLDHFSMKVTISLDSTNSIRDMMTTILNCLQKETEEKLMLELLSHDVTPHLRDLPNRVDLNETQQTLHAEVCRCIETGAYRAAVVMAWNLAYDFIRQWVFDNELDKFNQTLTTKYAQEHPNALQDYEEFFTRDRLGEYIVLHTAREAGIIGGRLFDKLVHYLRERNKYAHANSAVATKSKTNSYIECLIEIMTDSPFSGDNAT